jgi:hypothetical protein
MQSFSSRSFSAVAAVFTLGLACSGGGGSPGTAGTSGTSGAGGTGGTSGGGGTGGAQPVDARRADAAVADVASPPPRDAPPDSSPDVAGDPAGCPDGAGAGSVLDPRTCLVFERAIQASLNARAAGRRCEALSLDGHDDWRAPAPEELAAWADLPVNSNAYVTNPTYIPSNATDMDGCLGDAHSCNISQYNAGSKACAWQGVGFAGPSLCVRGTARAGSLSMAHQPTQCEACRVHVGVDFKQANCLPFGN